MKKIILWIALVVVVAVVLYIAYYLLSPLWRVVEVRDAAPVANVQDSKMMDEKMVKDDIMMKDTMTKDTMM